jgi:signal peptidase I
MTSSPNTAWKTAAASLPLFLWVRDSFFGVCHVRGTSMEPALQDGDFVLVRKCESGVLANAMVRFLWSGSVVQDDQETERARLRRYEQLQGTSRYVPMSRSYECPPTALSGHVAICKNPDDFPGDYCVKRVVGVGGQWMRTSSSSASSRSRRLQSIPPHSLYLEGDNRANSRDSRHYGPVSKNLLVGIAEYVVWPPSRWQRIQRLIAEDERGESRAFWP